MSAHVQAKELIWRVFRCIRKRFRMKPEHCAIIATMAKKGKNPYSVALGRKGGKKGGPARALPKNEAKAQGTK